MKKLVVFLLSLWVLYMPAQTYQQGYRQSLVNPELSAGKWPAYWVSTPGSDGSYEVSHFRKSFFLQDTPESFVVHVSADNRYKLFVNGQMVSLGPARCDIFNWNYETVDISPYLHEGRNVLAAVVWNYAALRPAAQVSYGSTELILQGNTRAEQVVNTDSSWVCITDKAYTPCVSSQPIGYYVAGPGERIDGSHYPWGWEQADYDDAHWLPVAVGEHGIAKGSLNYEGRYLVPSPIPPMEMNPTLFDMPTQLLIPAHTRQTILLDQKELTTGYLTMLFSKGKDAGIRIGYAESLYEHGKESKGNRNDTAGKDFWGYCDSIVADGGSARRFTSLWWRTWRYVQLTIETQDEPLQIDDVAGITSMYPFQCVSRFQADKRQDLQDMLDIGWRTARLCANETYMDCPYYEQMQYFGDTRIQTMITLYNTRDTIMVKRALELGRQSMSPDGIAMSRYPTSSPQFIPAYALSWAGIAYDYWMMRDDEDYVRTLLPAIRSVMAWYMQWLKEDHSLGDIPFWNFTDWAEEFDFGQPRKDATGHSAFLDFEFLKALQEMSAMERAIGLPAMADHYDATARLIASSAKEKYWSGGRQMFADNQDRDLFSQHVNVLAILTGLVSGEEARQLFERLNSDTSIAQCTIYYRYYLHQAMAMAGLGDQLLDNLGIWQRQMALGLTTWAERPEPSRSDCHAWGATPNIEFLRMVLGIRSAAPGFSAVEIAPSLGQLQQVSGSVPHPQGDVTVSYQRRGQHLEAVITLPEGINGRFLWQGEDVVLHSGRQTVSL